MKAERNASLEELRGKVRDLTAEILSLFGKRIVLAKQIGEYKREKGFPVVDRAVEKSLQADVKQICRREGIDEDVGLKLLGFLFKYSVGAQGGEKKPPGHMAVFAEAKRLESQGRRIVHLEIGEPDYGPPDAVIEATYGAMRDGRTDYTESAGIPQLREAVGKYLSRTLNVQVSPRNLLITPGGRFATYLSMASTLEPGDSVLIFEPAWPAYAQIAELLGARVVSLKTRFERRWIPDLEAVREVLDETVKMIVINTPNNPTGAVLTSDTMHSLAEHAARFGSTIVSDEVYSELSFKPFTSILHVKGSKSILVSSLSKSHGMTGFRVGYAVSDEETVRKMISLQSTLVTSVPEFVQYGSLAAVGSESTYLEHVQNRMKLASKALSKLPVEFHEPDGGLYLFPRIKKESFDSVQFAQRLLTEKGVAVSPGTAFGDFREYLRICFSAEEQALLGSIEKMGDLLK